MYREKYLHYVYKPTNHAWRVKNYIQNFSSYQEIPRAPLSTAHRLKSNKNQATCLANTKHNYSKIVPTFWRTSKTLDTSARGCHHQPVHEPSGRNRFASRAFCKTHYHQHISIYTGRLHRHSKSSPCTCPQNRRLVRAWTAANAPPQRRHLHPPQLISTT